LVALVTGVMVAVAGLASAGSAQTGDLTAWCQARVDTEAAFGVGDEDAIAAGLEALASAAPAEIAEASTTLADGLGEKGEAAFEDEAVVSALVEVDAYVVANCGFNVVEASGIDYEFEGVPDSLPAGTVAINFTNDAPKEDHEIVVFRVNDGVQQSAKKLLLLPEKKAQQKVTFAAAAMAEPGDTQASVTQLEPGRYVYGCFLPVGGKKKGKPHVTKGMFGEFEVEAG